MARSSKNSSCYFSVEEAALYCSMSISTIRRLLARGKLTPYRPSRRVLIDREELDRWIRQGESR